MKHKVKIIYFNFFQDVKKKVIWNCSYLTFICYINKHKENIFIDKKRDENKEVDRPSKSNFS